MGIADRYRACAVACEESFNDDRIANLREDFESEAEKSMGEWMAAHGAKLQG